MVLFTSDHESIATSTPSTPRIIVERNDPVLAIISQYYPALLVAVGERVNSAITSGYST